MVLGTIATDVPRTVSEQDPAFAELFRAARARLAAMDVRFVELPPGATDGLRRVRVGQARTSEDNSVETH